MGLGTDQERFLWEGANQERFHFGRGRIERDLFGRVYLHRLPVSYVLSSLRVGGGGTLKTLRMTTSLCHCYSTRLMTDDSHHHHYHRHYHHYDYNDDDEEVYHKVTLECIVEEKMMIRFMVPGNVQKPLC